MKLGFAILRFVQISIAIFLCNYFTNPHNVMLANGNFLIETQVDSIIGLFAIEGFLTLNLRIIDIYAMLFSIF